MNSEQGKSRDWIHIACRSFVTSLTTALWLLSVALGVLALLAFLRIVEYGGALLIIQSRLIAARYARGTLQALRYAAAVAGGLLLLGVAVLGMDFHFKNRGQRRSWRIFALTFGVELLLLLVDRLFVPGG